VEGDKRSRMYKNGRLKVEGEKRSRMYKNGRLKVEGEKRSRMYKNGRIICRQACMCLLSLLPILFFVLYLQIGLQNT